jgi:hypothetical protein
VTTLVVAPPPTPPDPELVEERVELLPEDALTPELVEALVEPVLVTA